MKVRIIDSKDRAVRICEVLTKLNSLPRPRLTRVPSGDKINDELQLNPDVFFLHINDHTKPIEIDGKIESVASNTFFESVIENLPNCIVLIYSGGVLSFDRSQDTLSIQSDTQVKWRISSRNISRFFVIPRPISTGDELVELNILKALEIYSQNRNISIFYQTLQPTSVFEYLESLSWLCQGYLAVTDPASLEQEEVQSIVSSWSFSELEEKRTLVSSPVEWWRKPFEPLEVNALRAKVREEWNSEEGWAPIEHLLNAIEDTKKIPLGVVNSAYGAISRRLSTQAN